MPYYARPPNEFFYDVTADVMSYPTL